jgi:predicted glycosyltransferase
MKILIDIGHPAHVHYFKNFISRIRDNGHEVVITARDKEVTHQLLKEYKLEYFSRGKGKNSALGKIAYMFHANWFLYRIAKEFKPDYFLSFVSPYAAQVAWLMRKPHIAFDDTEHANMARNFYLPFTKVVFTPFCFQKRLGSKQIYFKGFMELFYLHPDNFQPDLSIYNLLKIPDNQPYILFRFVSWKANHDIGQSGLDLETKRAIIDSVKDKYRVFISAEGDLPPDMEEYRIKIPPGRMHDVLSQARLFIGEGATMASECAMLGTPAIYVNSLELGYMHEQEKLGLIYGFRSSSGVLEKVKILLSNPHFLSETRIKRDLMLKDMINPTELLLRVFDGFSQGLLEIDDIQDYLSITPNRQFVKYETV